MARSGCGAILKHINGGIGEDVHDFIEQCDRAVRAAHGDVAVRFAPRYTADGSVNSPAAAFGGARVEVKDVERTGGCSNCQIASCGVIATASDIIALRKKDNNNNNNNKINQSKKPHRSPYSTLHNGFGRTDSFKYSCS